jgi:EAL domain-containing protein (putative c-di-GMP-specific phosphodiesterase class I)/DNA-binding NarL/FixJ family response regulator
MQVVAHPSDRICMRRAMQLAAMGTTYAEAEERPDAVESGEADPIRVMIADDEDAIRAAISSLLDDDPGIVVIGEASDAQTAIELAAKRHPAVALLDVRMPRGGGPRAASEICKRSPETRVIALSALEDAASILEMLDAGASAYVGKGEDADKIVSTIHRLASEPAATQEATRERTLDDALGGADWRERRRHRAEDVQRVIDGGGPRIVFQPVFDLGAGTCVGAEALARFDATPTRSPERWFEEADKAGLRIEMELSAVRGALEGLERLPTDMFLSVNLSPITCCSPDLPVTMAAGEAERIVLEITEHTPVADYRQLSRCLQPMRASGVRVAVDDTGSGFSSLSHVLSLGPEMIKLDIAMCRGIETDGARQALVHALAEFADQIGADVVAEGIESSEQLIALRDAGVRFGQGFFLGRAEPLATTFETTGGR